MRRFCLLVSLILLIPSGAAAEEAPSGDPRAAQALAKVILERDFGDYAFDKCEIVSTRTNDRVPGLSGLMFAYYKRAAGSRIMLSVQYFESRERLQAFRESDQVQMPGLAERAWGDTVLWSLEDKVYSWTDGHHVLITVGGESVPREMVEAYLAVVPSRVAGFGKEPAEDAPAASRDDPSARRAADLRGAQAVAAGVHERDFGPIVFEHCRLSSEPGDPARQKNPTGRADVEYYDPAGGKTAGEVPGWAHRIRVTLQWFAEQDDLRAAYARLRTEHPALKRHEVDGTVLLRGARRGEDVWVWTDGKGLMVRMVAVHVRSIPAERIQAHLAGIPSRVAEFE